MFIGVVDKIEDFRDPFCYNNMRIVLQNGHTCWWSEKHTTLATGLIQELV
jgi:hypothetical protein